MQSDYTPEGEILTPFNTDERGIGLVDTINGLNQKSARTWQAVALVSLSAFFVSLVIIFIAIHMPKTVPVIVTVDSQGNASYIGKVDNALYTTSRIPEIAKYAKITTLIRGMFTRSIDRAAQKMYMQDASNAVQEGAADQLDSFFRTNNPFSGFGSSTAEVEIDPLLRQTDSTYYTTFVVTTKRTSGEVMYKERWSILCVVGFYKPTQESPLGIYIRNFDIKQLPLNEIK
jgi:type IV secretory pathway TrbF-like protein